MSDRAKKYNNIKLAAGIVRSAFSVLLLFLFISMGYSSALENLIRQFTANDFAVLIIYVLLAGFASSVIFFPLSYFTTYYIEHSYGLSNQTFLKWILENTKGAVVGMVIGLPLLLLFYLVIREFGELWWLPFTAALFFFSVILTRLLPVFILPLFYKVTPVANEALKERIIKLCSPAGMKVENVYQFDMSKNTKKANAAFTGLGSTKRILLGDTLLDKFNADEIETIVAHELGHYVKKHIVKNILIGTLTSFLSLYLISKLYSASLPFFGFDSITQIGAFPIIALWASLLGIILTPLTNWISRRFEYEADRFAVEITGKGESFISALEKLTDQNLADREPHPFVEWYFYSHPSIGRRLAFIKSLTKPLQN